MTDIRTELDAIVESMGGVPREGQQLMADAVAEAFESGDHVLVQAGTGTGKSLHLFDFRGKLVGELPNVTTQRNTVIRFSPKGDKIVIGSWDNTVVVIAVP